MDLNGGVNPTDQTNSNVPQYSAQPQEFQQAPMSGAEAAYQPEVSQPVYYNQVQPQLQATPQPTEPQYQAQSQTQVQPQQQVVSQPIQDVRPSWQQELQYSNPVDPPWVREQTGSVAVAGGITSYTGDSLNQSNQVTNSVSSEAYNLLTEPYLDTAPINSGGSSPKKKIVTILSILIGLSLVGGAIYAAYLTGYKKGGEETRTKLLSEIQDSSNKQDTQNQDSADSTEPSLDFELKKAEYINENVEGSIGDQVETSDGLVVLATKVDNNFELKTDATVSGSTAKATKIDLLIGNSDETNTKTIKASNFVLIGPDNIKINAVAEIPSSNNIPTSFTLNSGMKVKMSLIFYVPEGSSDLTLSRSQAYKLGDQTVVSSISINLGITTSTNINSNVTE